MSKAFLVTLTENSVTAVGYKTAKELPEPGENQYALTSPDELAEWPTETLIQVFNTTRRKPVTKFANKQVAIEQTWAALNTLAGSVPQPITPKAEAAPKAAKAPAAPRPIKVVEIDPGTELKAARRGGKVAMLIDMLSAKGGATWEALQAATVSKHGNPVDLRGWLRVNLCADHVYGLSTKLTDTSMILSLVYPDGVKAPLEHREPTPPTPPVRKPKVEPVVEAPKAKAKKAKKA